jgi:hypothetical protein
MTLNTFHVQFQNIKSPTFQAKSKRTDPPIGHFKTGELVTRWEHNQPAIYQVTKVYTPQKADGEALDVNMIFNDNIETPPRKVQPLVGHAAYWFEKVTVEKANRMIENWTRIKQMIAANQSF